MENKPTPECARKHLTQHLEQINQYAVGINIGSERHYVAVPEGLDSEPVRNFSYFTGDLEKMADRLYSSCSRISHP